MRVRIVTPLAVIVDEDADALRAEDDSGAFGILPGHAPFLTALAISIVSWRKDAVERFCAVRGGVMTVGPDVSIATREAVAGDDLDALDSEVLSRFLAADEDERTEHTETMRLQLNAIRRIMSRLQPGANLGEFQ